VLEAGFLKEAGDRYRLDGPLPPLAIPSTLQDSLMARLDRLSVVKEVAQIGAAIGRAFAHELLAAVSPLADNALQDALKQLTNSELVFRRGTPPDATYTFKHALVQDAAYGSLLKSRRQQLHTRIAEALEKGSPDTVQNEPELLAHHYTQAGLPNQAIDYWRDAGKRASLRSANIEAISHLKKGLELVQSQAEGRERDLRELEIQAALGPPITAIKGYAADETGQVYARALDLSRKLERPPQIFQVLYGLTTHLMFHGNLLEAQDLGEEFARQADTHGDLAARVVAHRIYGTCLHYPGNLLGARDQLEQSLALYDAELHGSIREEYGHDPKVFGSGILSLTLTVLGYPDRGLTHARKAVAYAEELKRPYNIGVANFLASYLHFIRREPGASLAHAEANLKIAVEQRFPFLESVARVVVGWARAEECPEKGVLQLTEGLKHYRTLQMRLYLPFFLGIYSETCMKAGRTAEALAGVAEALSIAETECERWYDPELCRLHAELLLAGSDPSSVEAESWLTQALEVARSQEARLWELRAATSLARLWQRQGKTEEANDLLGPVYGWFSEGFDTADLKEAKALLDELAA
jgi:predicted ATPase